MNIPGSYLCNCTGTGYEGQDCDTGTCKMMMMMMMMMMQSAAAKEIAA